MGLRGAHAKPLSRPQPTPKPHLTYQLVCWESRQGIDVQSCSSSCKQRANRRRKLAAPHKKA